MSAMDIKLPDSTDTSENQSLLSAAEKKMQCYKYDKWNAHMELVPQPAECRGCKNPHCYCNKRTKHINCTNKDMKSIVKRAMKRNNQYLEALHAHQPRWVPKHNIKFSQLSDNQREVGCHPTFDGFH
jgi:hypothetical protein